MPGQRVEEPVRTSPRFRDERLRVRCWRREQFFELGFTISDAAALAKSSADVHDTRSLLEAGCPHALAFRLVR
jgi:hypothetical protein